jgi:hypothetical protein
LYSPFTTAAKLSHARLLLPPTTDVAYPLAVLEYPPLTVEPALEDILFVPPPMKE